MRVIQGPFGIKFGDEIEVYFGTKRVEHRKPRRQETDLEVAIELLEHFKQNGLYKEWLKIDQMTEEKPTALKRLNTEEVYIHYLQGSWVRELKRLQEKILDLSLNEIWEMKKRNELLER